MQQRWQFDFCKVPPTEGRDPIGGGCADCGTRSGEWAEEELKRPPLNHRTCPIGLLASQEERDFD
ncbi:hypothetical protein NOR_07173 [Metarhizium rileyi]|uniref:Uncharacterized protein n=1 Tax=Metarhizium rileyi (strain RCEF 4871) TaxID=1649241 RepID=A0A166Z2B3_METRR|nr:hypothetical protein NOR_07173 [Metarhizium rileyi RCEF 4871]